MSVVYYRTGYEVEAYPTEKEWSIRLLIERSRAIKCPSIQYHLAGTKKVLNHKKIKLKKLKLLISPFEFQMQQVLNNPKILKKYLDENEVMQIQNVFVGLYSLDFVRYFFSSSLQRLFLFFKFILFYF